MTEYFTKFKQKTTISTEVFDGLNYIVPVAYDEEYKYFSRVTDAKSTRFFTYDGDSKTYEFSNSNILDDDIMVRDFIFTQIQNIIGDQYGYTIDHRGGDEIVVSLLYRNETDAINGKSPVAFSQAIDEKGEYIRATIHLSAMINGTRLEDDDLRVIIPREIEVLDNNTIKVVGGLTLSKNYFIRLIKKQ